MSEASSPTFKETNQIPDVRENNSEQEIKSRTESQQSDHETQDDKLFPSHITSDTFTDISYQSQIENPGATENKKQQLVFPTSDDDIQTFQ